MNSRKLISLILTFSFLLTASGPDYLFAEAQGEEKDYLRPPCYSSIKLLDKISFYLGTDFPPLNGVLEEFVPYRIYIAGKNLNIERLKTRKDGTPIFMSSIRGYTVYSGRFWGKGKPEWNRAKNQGRELIEVVKYDANQFFDWAMEEIKSKPIKKILIVGPGPTLGEAFSVLEKLPEIEKICVLELNRDNVIQLCYALQQLYLDNPDKAKKIEIYQADVNSIPFEDNYFDMVYSVGAMMREVLRTRIDIDSDTSSEAWRELCRVTKLQGFGITMVPLEEFPKDSELNIRKKRIFSAKRYNNFPMILFQKNSNINFTKHQDSSNENLKKMEVNVLSLESIKEILAWEILSILNLQNPDQIPDIKIIETRQGPNDLTIRRITIPARAKPTQPLEGLSILQNELTPKEAYEWINTFELLYNKKGYLIAVFPVINPEDYQEPDFLDDTGPDDYDTPKYFDFSDYYFEVPPIDDPQAKTKWINFIKTVMTDKEAIQSYRKSMSISNIIYKKFSNQTPYEYIELDHFTGKAEIIQVNLQKLDIEKFFTPKKGKYQLIFPVFPTVYSPANNAFADEDVIPNIWIGKEFDLQEGDTVFERGPGSGINTWVVSLKTKRKVYAWDINPFANANVRALAKIGGFKVEINIPDSKVDRIVWSMPAYTEYSKKGQKKKLADHWDGDYKGAILKDFASELRRLLKPDGKALLWNKPFRDMRHEPDRVAEILKSGGEYNESGSATKNRLNVVSKESDKGTAIYIVTLPPLSIEIKKTDEKLPSLIKPIKPMPKKIKWNRFLEQAI